MKRQIWVYLASIAIIIVTAGAVAYYNDADDQAEQINTSPVRSTAPLPASLDNLYPPIADQPVWMLKMLEMDFPFTGIVVDLLEEDIPNALDNFEKFKALYLELSELVPEWQHMFPIEPVDKLGEALQTGDPGRIMGALENVGAVCHDCHVPNMVKAQQKYHWPDFKMITVQDPLTNDILDYSMFMRYLNVTFSGILLNARRGNVENAQRYFQGFKARFETLQESCYGCHNTERMYYVDERVQSLIDNLGETLLEPEIDPDAVFHAAMGIGKESCQGCHLVHLPAAFAKYEWK